MWFFVIIWYIELVPKVDLPQRKWVESPQFLPSELFGQFWRLLIWQPLLISSFWSHVTFAKDGDCQKCLLNKWTKFLYYTSDKPSTWNVMNLTDAIKHNIKLQFYYHVPATASPSSILIFYSINRFTKWWNKSFLI